MTDKIIKLLNLPADAGEDQILGRIKTLQDQHVASRVAADREEKIGHLQRKCGQSREAAIETLKLHEQGEVERLARETANALEQQAAQKRMAVRQQARRQFIQDNPKLAFLAQ